MYKPIKQILTIVGAILGIVVSIMTINSFRLSNNSCANTQNNTYEAQPTNSELISNNNTYEDQNSSYAQSSEVYLADLDIFHEKNIDIYRGPDYKLNTGDKINNAIATSLGSGLGEIQYYLNGNYSNLTATFGVTNAKVINYVDESYDVEIYADDSLVFSYYNLLEDDLPVYIDVDITGCKILKIKLKAIQNYAVLVDAIVSK